MAKSTARRIFVAHAEKDRDALKQLRDHFGRKDVQVTSRDDVSPGGALREETDRLIDAADLVVVLLSADLLGSELWEHEIERLFGRRPDARVIPVLLRAVDLEGSRFAGTALLPGDGIPVASHPNADEAWTEIVRELRQMLAALTPRPPESRPSSSRATPTPATPLPVTPRTPIPPPSSSQPPLPKKLVEALQSGSLVPFAGAGVSMAVMDKQRPGQRLFPSWAGLLELAAERLDADGNEGDAMAVRGAMKRRIPSYLEAARNARDGLREGWKDLLHDVIDRPREQARDDSLDLARALWDLGSRLLITTNYDKVLHWSCPDLPNLHSWDIEAPAELAQMLQKGVRFPTVWHLHGFVGNTANLILTPDGYEHLYPTPGAEVRHKAALAALQMLLTLRTLLFVGVSFDDASFAGQLKWLGETFGGAAGPHYVLVREAEREMVTSKIAALPLRVVSYADHGAPLVALLRRLAAARAGTIP